ncbi:MAG: tyrosine-protein phosphatase [Bradymonadaceae bacterium]
MHDERNPNWGDCWNARDLGGLPLENGGRTAWKSVVRASSLHVLTDEDWRTVVDYGIRTVVDLRHGEDLERQGYEPPEPVERFCVPLEEGLIDDPEYAEWAQKGWLSTPLYYPRFVERWPRRVAEALRTVARAADGGVVIHCGAGRDRTGLIVSQLLSLVGVKPAAIADDHELWRRRIDTDEARRAGMEDDEARIDAVLERTDTSYRRALLDFIDAIDVERTFVDAGLSEGDLEALEERLLAR